MKKLEEILFIVQARLNSERVPNKMLRQLSDTNEVSTLTDIVLSKINLSKVIPRHNFYFSAYEYELKKKADNHQVQVFNRTIESKNGETLKDIYQWHRNWNDEYKYVIIISGCHPFLKVETIDNFINTFLAIPEEALFGVTERHNYYWHGKNMRPVIDDRYKILNTKYCEPTYEAAHCLYASRIDMISEGYFMSKLSDYRDVQLFIVNERESVDIDTESDWQYVKYLWNENKIK